MSNRREASFLSISTSIESDQEIINSQKKRSFNNVIYVDEGISCSVWWSTPGKCDGSLSSIITILDLLPIPLMLLEYPTQTLCSIQTGWPTMAKWLRTRSRKSTLKPYAHESLVVGEISSCNELPSPNVLHTNIMRSISVEFRRNLYWKMKRFIQQSRKRT